MTKIEHIVYVLPMGSDPIAVLQKAGQEGWIPWWMLPAQTPEGPVMQILCYRPASLLTLVR